MRFESHRQELLEFALQLAEAAEQQILPVYRNCAVDWKPDGSEVTEADRQAERVMREMIAQRFPGHEVLGEEYGGARSVKPQWLLDPVDGTESFTAGVPIFGTLIAYLEHGEPRLGVIHFPALGETVYAARGAGCWFRARGRTAQRLQVAADVSLEEAIVSATGIHGSDIQPSDGVPRYTLSALIPKARKFRFFSDCLQHALVCQGRIHAGIDTIMQPWDIAAIVPCVAEAGGVATNLSGEREGVVWGGSLLTASGRRLHQQIVEALRPA